MAKSRKPTESISGTYAAIPHAVLDSVAFTKASHTAQALLFQLMRQHNGNNNGHLQLSSVWLAKRGWNSRDTATRASQELIERGLITKTKQGGLNMGPSRYALTWLSILNHQGLDIRPADYCRGGWIMMDPQSPIGNKTRVPPDGTGNTARRYSTIPPDGTAKPPTVP